MVEKVEMWKTSDGERFDNEYEAREHEEKATRDATIDAYIAQAYPDANGKRGEKAHATRARNAIVGYLEFVERGRLEEPVPDLGKAAA